MKNQTNQTIRTQRIRRCAQRIAATLLLSAGLLAGLTISPAWGDQKYWKPVDGSTDFTNTANWETRTATGSEWFFPDGATTAEATISNGDFSTVTLQVGSVAGSSGTINITGGTLTNTANGRFGNAGNCIINQSGGVFASSGYLADGGSSRSTYNLTGGKCAANFAGLGTRGIAVVNISGDAWNSLDSTGTLWQAGTQTLCFGGNTNGSATINQSGGTASTGTLQYGGTDFNNGRFGGQGTYNLTGGTLTSSSIILNDAVYGASLNNQTNSKNVVPAFNMYAQTNSDSGAFTTSGGTATVSGAVRDVPITISAGTLTINGSYSTTLRTGTTDTLVNPATKLTMSEATDSASVKTSGTITVGTISNVPITASAGVLKTTQISLNQGVSTLSGSLKTLGTASLAAATPSANGVFLSNNRSDGVLNLSGSATLTVSAFTDVTTGGFYIGSAVSATPAIVNISGTAKLDASSTKEVFYLGSQNSSAAGHATLNLSESSVLWTNGAQLARPGGATATINMSNNAVWKNINQGRFGEFGKVVININDSAIFAPGKAHFADQNGVEQNPAWTTTVNLNGGKIAGGAILGTRGTATFNIYGGEWTSHPLDNNNQVSTGNETVYLCYGAKSTGRGTVNQMGGTVNLTTIQYGSMDTSNGKYGGQGVYNLTGGTLNVTTVSLFDIVSAAGSGVNISPSLVIKAGTDSSGNPTTGTAAIGTITNVPVTQSAGVLDVTTYNLNAGVFEITGGEAEIDTLNITDNATLKLVLGASYQPLTIKNSLDGNGAFEVSLVEGFPFDETKAYTLIDTDGSASLDLAGMTPRLPVGITLVNDGSRVIIGSSAAVPEPASWLLLLTGVCGVIACGRKRR